VFLNPGLLLVLPAVLIPIIIHLINRRRFKVKRWAAIEFIIPSSKRLARKFKLKQILLLLTRIFILLFLIVALARPYVSGLRFFSFFLRQKPVVIIILDNSLSMSYLQGNQTRFKLAQEKGKRILDALPKGSSASLILLSDKAQNLFPKPISDLERVKRALSESSLTQGATDFLKGIGSALDIVQKEKILGASIYLVTDFQECGWQMDNLEGWLSLQNRFVSLERAPQLRVIKVSDGEEENCALTYLKFSSPFIRPSEPFEIEAVAKSKGVLEKEKLFTLCLDGERKSTLSSSKDRDCFYAHFTLTLNELGHHYGWVTMGEDALEADNRRFFVLRSLESIKVLCVDGDPSGEPFKGETDFLKIALDPTEGEGLYGKSIIEPKVILADALSKEVLGSYEVVIFANLPTPPSEMISELESYVREGGALVIFLGELCVKERYNQLLYSPSEPLLPVRLGEMKEKEREYTFSLIDEQHPVVKSIENPHQIKIYKYFSVEVDEDDPQVSILARLDDHNPWLVKRKYGKGKVVLFTIPCDANWSNLPLTMDYLPLLHRLIYYLAKEGEYMLSVNGTIRKELTSEQMSAQISISGPAGSHFEERIPAARTISFSKTALAGIYTLSFLKGNNVSVYRYALNPREEESSLKEAKWEEVKGIMKNIPLQFFHEGDVLGDSPAMEGGEIWKWLVLMVFLPILAEVWLCCWIE